MAAFAPGCGLSANIFWRTVLCKKPLSCPPPSRDSLNSRNQYHRKKEAKKDCPGLNFWTRSQDLPKVERWLKVITPSWHEGCRRYSYQLANSFTEPIIHPRHSPRFLSHRNSGLGTQKKKLVAAVLNRPTSHSHPGAFFSYSLLAIYFLICAAHIQGHPVTFGSKLPTSCIQQSCGQCPKYPKFCSF